MQVATDQPVLACMAAQYAGWQIAVGKFFAMGSGPMRAAYGKEELFDHITRAASKLPVAVGVLEIAQAARRRGGRLPVRALEAAGGQADAAGGAGRQHGRQPAGRGPFPGDGPAQAARAEIRPRARWFPASAPPRLPPVASDELQAIGRTNDAILYGGRVVLWVQADDDQLAEIGPKVPSSASPDHGAPFADDLQALRGRFLQDRSDAVQPGRGRVSQPGQRQEPLFLATTESDVLVRSFLGAGVMDVCEYALAFSAGDGWHVRDLQRAAGRADHEAGGRFSSHPAPASGSPPIP